MASREFLALKRLISLASLRALSITPLPVRVFVFDPDEKLSREVFPEEPAVVLALPSARIPILGNRGMDF